MAPNPTFMDEILRRFSADDITWMMENFRTKVLIRDHRVGFKVHKDCFVGQEAVTTIASEFGLSRYEALLVGRVFESRGLFCHAGKDKEVPLRDGIYFYQFLGRNSRSEDSFEEKPPHCKNVKQTISSIRRKICPFTGEAPSSSGAHRKRRFSTGSASSTPTSGASPVAPSSPLSPNNSPLQDSFDSRRKDVMKTGDSSTSTSFASILDTYFTLPVWQQVLALVAFSAIFQSFLLSMPFALQALVTAMQLSWGLKCTRAAECLRHQVAKQTASRRSPRRSHGTVLNQARHSVNPTGDISQKPSSPVQSTPSNAKISSYHQHNQQQMQMTRTEPQLDPRTPFISGQAKLASDIRMAHQSRDYLQLAQLSEQVANDLTEALQSGDHLRDDRHFMELLKVDEGTPPEGCRLLQTISESDVSFLLSDPKLPGHPIVYASPNFKEITGYTDEEIRDLNKTQQLHGPETSIDTLLAVQQAIIDKVPISVRLRLYKKNRVPFWCQFYVQPLFAADGTLDKWLAIHHVTEGDDAPELLMLPRTKLQPPEVPLRSPEVDRMVHRLRGQLQQDFPGVNLSYFDDDFLAYVAGKPGRTYEYCIEKLRGSVQWRVDMGVDSITEAQVMPTLLSTEMFWHRFDVFGRPVLYLRPAKQDMRTFDRMGTFKAIVYTMEQGLKLMPPGVVTCILVIDAEGVGWAHFDTQLTRLVLSMASVGYRDRVDRIVVGPTGVVVATAWKFVRSYISENLKKKIHITNAPATDLSEFINRRDIPHHVFKA